MLNGSGTSYRHTVAEIKTLAKEQAQKASRGASASSLLKSARTQIQYANAREDEGDFKEALSALTQSCVVGTDVHGVKRVQAG
ncbi:hypothetical protein A0H81_06401 [Grifola frondosa]|uniref:Uncharacterized protein n=1 Tax=Grifola frondosa TaxID=5627 RepID=A0A1C7M9N9_GRIFR|nr:hypothetical protein A0H81_06401 [Grifola frondosa]